MRAHSRTATRGSDGLLVEVVEVVEVGEVVPGFAVASCDGAAGVLSGAASGAAAAGSVTAAGVRSWRRDWIVPVTRPASRATFHRRSEAAGSRRWRRVTSHATPSSTVLWIR